MFVHRDDPLEAREGGRSGPGADPVPDDPEAPASPGPGAPAFGL